MGDRDQLGGNWKTIASQGDDVPEPECAEPELPSSTFIGAGARFEGNLQLRGDFRLDGEFRGKLETDGSLIVGEDGSVEGDIHARGIEVRGAVVGNVYARSLVVLYSGARLHGDVETACIEVQRQAFFCGSTKMTRPQESTRQVATDDRGLAGRSLVPPVA